MCLPLALSHDDMDALDAIIKRGRPVQKGEHLFYQGDEFKSVFAVRTGTVKTYTLTNEGEEQITGFHLASELVGLESYDSITYPASAKALETTNVCEIPVDRLDELSGKMPELRRQLMRLMSKELREEQQMMLLLSKKSAEERIASFLINLAARFKRRGFSGTSFRLTMSRADIANYLGLAVETVSRVFTRFQKQGLLEATGSAKDIVISNFDELTNIASLAECERIELGVEAG
ncbi:transcriptional regulator Anr [Reinekea sp. MED297]|uniref:Transcriptional regulator Anr n=1 Tax=Reinekea blandensis MED297 TaxID=314283 RepID=A4BCL3_9GAMM|nr:transcriptional regulator Anr [Reinekea sp. MED297] [Reinekea blandensis MED297]